MPYYRHLKELGETQPEDGQAFDDMVSAREEIDVKTETVTFIASDIEKANWHYREENRFGEFVYTAVPWLAQDGYPWNPRYIINSDDTTTPNPCRYHYPHLSTSHPGLIAYTKNDEHGVQDRQTRIKPGRYLEEFHKGEYTDEQVAAFIAQCVVVKHDLKIARSTDEIVAIYSRKDISAIQSCMQSKNYPEYSWQVPYENGNRPHPCAVYGESDLGVAYLGDIDGELTSRCVVWPGAMLWSRIYGNTAVMTQALKLAGYTQGWPDGAKVRYIKANGEPIMPYVDGIDGATRDCDWIVLGSGRIQTGNTSGYGSSYEDETEDNCDDDDDREMITCEHCHSEFDYGTMGSGQANYHYCDDCLRSRNRCEECAAQSWDDLTSVGDSEWCDDCVNRATIECTNPVMLTTSCGNNQGAGSFVPCAETWVELSEFNAEERQARQDTHTSHLCRICAEYKQVCQYCTALFDDDLNACDTCGLSVRCTVTQDMFGHSYESSLAASMEIPF